MGFLSEFFRHPGEVGAIAPSGGALARLVAEAADLADAQVVVECGPGTGVFTERLLSGLPEGATFLALEINPAFVAATRERCPGARVIHDSAENIAEHLSQAGASACDRVISGLPWAAFDEDRQDRLLSAIVDALRPGGLFLTFAYLQGVILPAGKRFRRKLDERFGNVRATRTVWWNLPPAFVYVARK